MIENENLLVSKQIKSYEILNEENYIIDYR